MNFLKISLNPVPKNVSRIDDITRPELPEFDGKTTQGVFETPDGKQIWFESGGTDPKYKNYIPAGHVEGKTAIYMNENGLMNGTVFHNNTNGTCGFCDKMLPTLLPEGSVLKVVPPINAAANNLNAVDVIKDYIGNSNPIKITQ